MKKVKVFFVAAALLLVTISVFASRERFLSGDLFAASNSVVVVYYPLTNNGTFVDLTTTTGRYQVTITDSHNNTYSLVTENGLHVYEPLYPVGW